MTFTLLYDLKGEGDEDIFQYCTIPHPYFDSMQRAPVGAMHRP